MKIALKERAFSTAAVISFAVLLGVLAMLQYRWSAQVSEATSIRLADSLEMSMVNWHQDFFRGFSEICLAMQVEPEGDGPRNLSAYGARFEEWKAEAAYPDLVSGLYVIQDGKFNKDALVFTPSERRFEQAPLPSKFLPLRGELQDASLNLSSSDVKSYQYADRFFPGGRLAGWLFEPDLPALVHSIPGADTQRNNVDGSPAGQTNWLVIELNDSVIRTRILPDLSQRYFQGTNGLDYEVAVVSTAEHPHSIYTSDPSFGEPEVPDADGRMSVFVDPSASTGSLPIRIFRQTSRERGPAQAVGITWFPTLRHGADDPDWQLVVRHRNGGALGAFVAEMRRRNLMVSFGVLLLLLISMAMLIITTMRAQRLAKLQMDFVTAVSHELRTPLTVISSAADNITSGVVEGKSQLTQYGSVIGGQARRLSGLVERILLFAAIREGRQRYSLRPLSITEIVDAALASAEGLIRAAHFTVEQDVASNLPQVNGDLLALSQCLQNLITNALKYSGDHKWLGIRARALQNGAGQEVEISVSDRGIGIAAAHLPHIFEPFYRSPSARSARIHGTGLGLPLAKNIAEAMKGNITVTSSLAQGSTFTLHLPACEPVYAPEMHVNSTALY